MVRWLWFVLTLTVVTVGHAAQLVPNECPLCIKTPSLSSRESRKLRLNNGLEAYLISDPGLPESAAGVVVDVGSWQNPPDRDGVAHFCEHLLFLGNAAYPKEGEFRHFLEEHGGQTNAYTTDTHTNYLFSVQDSGLEEALARLANFFIDPLFDADAMQRELNAVDQEFQRTIENDDRRQLMVLKLLANPHHPFSRFAAGNQRTLASTTSEEMRTWFASHYSANLMHLVVLSSRPLDELEAIVTREFEQIPNHNYAPWVVSDTQFPSPANAQIAYITPHQHRRELTLVWELPYNYQNDLETHAANLVSSALGHEGEHSLLTHLKREGLADALSCGVWKDPKPHTPTCLFLLNLELTDQGVEKHRQVVTSCFSAIRGLQLTGIPTHLHNEMATIQQLNYEFQTRASSFNFVSALVEALPHEELATFPHHTLIPERYDAEAIQSVLTKLSPSSVHILVTAPSTQTGVQPQKQEQWLNVPYTVAAISPSQQREWSEAAPHPDVTTPAPNLFMPNDPQVLYHGEPQHTLPTPELVHKSDFLSLYFAADEHYQVPEIAWRFRIKSAEVNPGDATDAVLTDLLARSITRRLRTISYPAEIAGLSFTLEARPDGLTLSIDGGYQKALLLLEHILEAFTHGVPTAEEFDQYKSALRKQYDNVAREEPILQGLAMLREVLHLEEVPASARSRALRQIDYQQLVLFFDAFRDRTFVEGMLFGNMTADEAENVEKLLRTRLQRNPFPPNEQIPPSVVSLPKQKGPFYLTKKVKSQGNALILAIEEGPLSVKRRAAQQILATGIEAPFFEQLRTKQQTGYIVQTWAQNIEHQLFQFFAVQSSRYSSRELLARFELFIEQFVQSMRDETFPKERFETIQRSWIDKLSQLPKNPQEMGTLLATLAFDRDADFDWINARIRGLQSLTYEEFLALAAEFLGRTNRQRLAILIEGRTGDEPLQYHRIRSVERLKQMSDYQ